MKAFDIIKKAVTIITLALLTLDIFTDINFFPYALIGFSAYCFLKSKEYYDGEEKNKFIIALLAGVAITAVIIFMILK